ncbi:hypothetical protein HKBW3S44_00256, partial [Candidatus Hakubella thermalkaliphila]
MRSEKSMVAWIGMGQIMSNEGMTRLVI